MITGVSNSKSPSFRFCMVAEEDGTTIINEDKIISSKNPKITELCNF